MRTRAFQRAVVILTILWTCWVAAADEPGPAPVNPFQGRQEREEVYEFVEKPKVAADCR